VEQEGEGRIVSVLPVCDRLIRGGMGVEGLMGEERLVENGGRAGGLLGMSIILLNIGIRAMICCHWSARDHYWTRRTMY
jgi:hypothetical protein